MDDSPGLQSCMVSAYSSYQRQVGSARFPPLDANYADEIKNFPTWVAECSGKIVGAVIMMFERDYAVVSNIAVHPEFQRRGLGSELMRFAEEMARERLYTELRLTTHTSLSENVSLYLHLGWTEFYRDDVRVYMRKEV